MNKLIKQIVESKFNFNIDIEDNNIDNRQNSLFKSIYKSKSLKKLYEEHQYIIDLELPSKTKWCRYNLGCDYDLLFNHPEKSKVKDWYGDYYQWGKIKTQNVYSKRTYKNYGVDFLELPSKYDAAYLNMHYLDYKFYMPSKNLFEELLQYTEFEWVKNYNKIEGLNGVELISKLNNNRIFFPASGFDAIAWKDFFGGFWSTTQYNLSKESSYALIFNMNYSILKIEACYKYGGYCIRPIVNYDDSK